MQQKVAYNY